MASARLRLPKDGSEPVANLYPDHRAMEDRPKLRKLGHPSTRQIATGGGDLAGSDFAQAGGRKREPAQLIAFHAQSDLLHVKTLKQDLASTEIVTVSI